MVKNPPSNAGNMGLIPNRGMNITHVVQQLSLCATIINARTHGTTREKLAHFNY